MEDTYAVNKVSVEDLAILGKPHLLICEELKLCMPDGINVSVC